jgi:carbonic anhydrase/acetyltransferase-like protein (isoleucine patch superfamily)
MDDVAGALLVGGLGLQALQAREGGPCVEVTPGDVLPAYTDVAWAADAVFSRATVHALRQAAASGALVQAAVKKGTPLWRSATRLLDDVKARDVDLRLPLWAGPLGGQIAQSSPDAVDAFPAAVPVAVCDEDGAVTVRVPPYGRPPHVVAVPSVMKLGGRLMHWLHLLELSLAALETERRALGLLHGRNRFRGDVDVHPTATVIGSILEAGVNIEPYASVIDSFVGKEVLIADHSVVHSCVIGDGCRSLVDTSLRRVVAMAGSTLSNIHFTDSVIGRDVFLTTSVATFAPPGEDASVDGRDTGRALLGAAIGARCVLGTRALLKAGTALPPGLLVVARPGEAASKLDDEGLARATMMRGDRTTDA